MTQATPDPSPAAWRKSRSSAHGGNCVEAATNLPGVVLVRDSKRDRASTHIHQPRLVSVRRRDQTRRVQPLTD